MSGLKLASHRPAPVLCSRLYCIRLLASTADTSNHHDLASFLDYASRANLSQDSTVFVGTRYEYTVMKSLSRLHFKLARTGGRLDGGIDLLGTWSAPTLPTNAPLRVLLQCKALNRKPGPNLIRELEGAFAGVPASWRKTDSDDDDDSQPNSGSSGVMAILVASQEATKGVRDAIGRSRWPMGYAKITLDGCVEQLLWNKSAAIKGLEGLGVIKKFRPVDPDKDVHEGREHRSENAVKEEIALTFGGAIWDARDGDSSRSTD